MKLICVLSLLVLGSSHAQFVEINSVAAAVVSGRCLYYQILDRNAFRNQDPKELEYSDKWHKLQTVEVFDYILVGVQIGLESRNNLTMIAANIIEVAAIRWIVRDGVYQLSLGNNFWNLSDNTTARFEQLGKPLVKISFLLFAILFKYFVADQLSINFY